MRMRACRVQCVLTSKLRVRNLKNYWSCLYPSIVQEIHQASTKCGFIHRPGNTESCFLHSLILRPLTPSSSKLHSIELKGLGCDIMNLIIEIEPKVARSKLIEHGTGIQNKDDHVKSHEPCAFQCTYKA